LVKVFILFILLILILPVCIESFFLIKVLCFFLHSLLSRRSIWSSASNGFLLSWLQNLEGAHQGLVHSHHGTCIIELSTVVGSTEQSHELSLSEELVAVFHDLMGSADEVHLVLF